MVDLTKFSKEDLQKTKQEIDAFLKKADETDFKPDETVDHGTHEEETLGGESKKIVPPTGETTEKSEVKKENPMMEKPDEGITEPSQTDVLQQILTILQEIRGKIQVPAPVAPVDEIKMAAPAPAPAASPAVNIQVTKELVTNVLKEMGMTPSKETPKPKIETGHPIEKKDVKFDLKSIGKMSWDDCYNLDMNIREEKKEKYF